MIRWLRIQAARATFRLSMLIGIASTRPGPQREAWLQSMRDELIRQRDGGRP